MAFIYVLIYQWRLIPAFPAGSVKMTCAVAKYRRVRACSTLVTSDIPFTCISFTRAHLTVLTAITGVKGVVVQGAVAPSGCAGSECLGGAEAQSLTPPQQAAEAGQGPCDQEETWSRTRLR